MKIKFEHTEFPYHGGALKDELIKIRGNKCEDCGLTIWKNQPIPLEAHHIDGDRYNNTLENLILLCPNCHTLTPNYGAKNRNRREFSDEEIIKSLQTHKSIRQALFALGMSDAGANYERVRTLINNNADREILIDNSIEKRIKYCPDCGKVISQQATHCAECAKKASRVVERPDRETLKEEVYNTPFTELGKKYHVSDKSIQKWCAYYKLPSRRKDIKQFTKEEWMAL